MSEFPNEGEQSAAEQAPINETKASSPAEPKAEGILPPGIGPSLDLAAPAVPPPPPKLGAKKPYDPLPATRSEGLAAARFAELRGDRLASLKSFVDYFRNPLTIPGLKSLLTDFDPSILLQMLPEVEAFAQSFNGPDDTVGVKARVAAALALLQKWHTLQPGSTDSDFLAVIEKVLNQPTVQDGLATLVVNLLGHPPAMNRLGCTEKHVGDVVNGTQTELFEAAAIPWATILQLAQAIFALIQQWKTPPAPVTT